MHRWMSIDSSYSIQGQLLFADILKFTGMNYWVFLFTMPTMPWKFTQSCHGCNSQTAATTLARGVLLHGCGRLWIFGPGDVRLGHDTGIHRPLDHWAWIIPRGSQICGCRRPPIDSTRCVDIPYAPAAHLPPVNFHGYNLHPRHVSLFPIFRLHRFRYFKI